MYNRENLLRDVHKSTKLRPGAPNYRDEVMKVLLNVQKNIVQDAVVDLSTALVEVGEFNETKFKSNLEVNKLINLFVKQLDKNKWWRDANYMEDHVIKKHPKFFKTVIDFSNIHEDFKSPPGEVEPTLSTSDLGSSPDMTPKAKEKCRSQSTDSRHGRKVRLVAKEANLDYADIIIAAEQELWNNGKHAASLVLKSIKDDQEMALEVHRHINFMKDEDYEPEQSDTSLDMLALLLERNFSKEDMRAIIQFVSKMTGVKLPCYEKSIIPAKESCHPEVTDQTVSEEGDEATFSMQEVLNHTAKRTLMIPELANKIEDLRPNNEPITVTQTFKFGMDGFGNNPLFQQQGMTLGKDGTCIGSMLIPLQITTEVGGKTEELYTNSFFNSAQACRPLHLWYRKETPGKNTQSYIFGLCLLFSKIREINGVLSLQTPPTLNKSFE